MNVATIVQARMGSQRLPGKVLMDISGRPMLFHVVERLRQANSAGEVVVATTTSEADQEIVSFARDVGVKSFVGSEMDVLERFVLAAEVERADLVIRVTGDCPLIEPTIVDEMVHAHLASGADYTGNLARRTLPRGLDAEVVATQVLRRIHRMDLEPRHREHVTPFIYENPASFRVHHFEVQGKLRRPELRLCVDTHEDLLLMREIYRRFYLPGQVVDISAVIRWLDVEPQWRHVNIDAEQEHMLRNAAEGIRQVKLRQP